VTFGPFMTKVSSYYLQNGVVYVFGQLCLLVIRQLSKALT